MVALIDVARPLKVVVEPGAVRVAASVVAELEYSTEGDFQPLFPKLPKLLDEMSPPTRFANDLLLSAANTRLVN